MLDELVGVGELELAVAKGVHPDAGVFQHFFMPEQLRRSHRDILGGSDMSVRVKPRAVAVEGVCHAQLLGACVHHGNKRLIRPGNMLSQCHAGVIRRTHQRRLDQFMHRHGLAGFQPDLRTAHGSGVFAAGHAVLHGDLAIVQRLKDQQHGHDFGNGCLGELLVFVDRPDDSARFSIHQHGSLCGESERIRRLPGFVLLRLLRNGRFP